MKRKKIGSIIFTLTFLVSLSAVWCWNYKTVEISDSRLDKTETWKKILTYENKNLRALNNRQNIELFNDFYRIVDKDLYVGFGNSILFRRFVNEKNQIRFVLIGGENYFDKDSYEKLSFQIFDQDGNHLNSREIRMRFPFSIDTLKIRNLPGFLTETIEVTCRPEIPENYAEQLNFALIGNDIQRVSSAQVIE